MTETLALAALLCLTPTAFVAPAAAAQESASVPATALTPGTKIYDSAGEPVGTVAKVSGDKVAVAIDGNGLVVPRDAFIQTDKGPALKATKAKILAVLNEAERDAAAVEAALKVGAEVRSADGAAVLGKIKALTPQGAVMSTGEGDITMPRAAFFLAKSGLAVKVTAAQFAEGVKKARKAGG
jgi:preprotein translocase subunit YajC